MVILILIIFIVMCIAIDLLVHFISTRKAIVPGINKNPFQVFKETTVAVPKGLFFNKSHTWAFMEKNGLVKVGLDDFILHVTGPLSQIKMLPVGNQIRKGEPALTIIQDGKQLVINAPLSGTVKYQNIKLLKDISLINSYPVNEGWIYSIEPSNWEKEKQFLLMADKYKEWLSFEFSRLKDFLAYNRKTSHAAYVPMMLQDGGELKDNLLTDFDPEVWEDFQNKFINTSK